MIIGNGMMAQKFMHYVDNEVIFFASGVSNSNEINKTSFTREENLLLQTIKSNIDKIFVYFSSCDIENPHMNSKKYYKHKKKMEQLVRSFADRFYIFRLPQVVGKGGNENTLMNFLVHQIKHEVSFEVWRNTKKSIIDIDDVFTIIIYIVENRMFLNDTCNIFNNNYIYMSELVQNIEKFINKKAICRNIAFDVSCDYNSYHIDKVLPSINVKFDSDYIHNLLLKYYNI